MSTPLPIIGAGLVLIESGKVLLVRRRRAPRAGEWSLPGGKQTLNETIRETALRELKEETGLEAAIVGLVDVVDAVFPGADGLPRRYTLVDFAARPTGGMLHAGSDAVETVWHALGALPALSLWSETERVILEASRRYFGG